MIRRILRNFTWLSAATAIELGLSMIVTAVLARRLGPTGFGQYSLWLAFIAFFTPLYDFGLTPFSLRQVAQKPEDTDRYLRTAIATKVLLSLFGLLIIIGIAFKLDYFKNTLLGAAFVLLAVSQIAKSFALLNRAVFRAHEWMHLQTYIGAISNIARLSLILIVILIRPDLLMICLVLAIVNLSEVLISSVLIRRRTPQLSSVALPHNSKYNIRQLLKQSTPFALYDMFNGMYMRADTVLLGIFSGVQPVAWYSSAYKLATLVSLLPRTLMDGIYPILCKESSERVYQLVRRLLLILMGIAFPISLSLTVLAPEIIQLVYGSQYTPAVLALQILAWASFFVFGSSLLLATLNALHSENTVARIMSVIGVGGLISYALSIPKWGYIGASIVSTGIEFAGFLLMVMVVQQKFKRQMISSGTSLRLLSICGIALGISWLGVRHASAFLVLSLVLPVYVFCFVFVLKNDGWIPEGSMTFLRSLLAFQR